MKEDSFSYDRIPLYAMVFLTVLFCFFAITYEKYAASQAQDRLAKHARILADPLWNLNTAGVADYLHLATEADDYLSLEIINHNGEVFQTVHTDISSELEKFLISIHLIPKVYLVTPVWSRTQIIGWIEAVWLPSTLAVDIAVLVFLLMIQLVLMLYCRILQEKLLLKQRVRERTAELSTANTSLKKEIHERALAEKEREELLASLERSRKMESLGLLAGGVAHDLNNVLSGIVSYPDLLLHDMPENHPMRKAIMTIRDSGVRAAEIVQDLLSLARRGVVTKKTIDLAEVISEYCSSPEYHKLLEASGNTEVAVDIHQPLAKVMGSPVALKKVLMNLVANAAESQPNGGQIRITAENTSITEPLQGFQVVRPGMYVALRIVDHGEGISETDQQRIFEPFYTKKVMGRSGTGLGLTVVWGIVEDHQGTIAISSAVGQGTTFTVYLPACSDDQTQQAVEEVPLPELHGRGETVLVVDDMEHQREIACAILRRLNYNPVPVASGEEAIRYMQDNTADLMILDMIMDGGIDGLETYREIVSLRPGQKTLIASGFSETDRVLVAQQLGAGSYIKKPYKMEEIAVAIRQELLSRSA